MEENEIISYLESVKELHSQLCHASNILGKLADDKLKPKQRVALREILQVYYQYLKTNFELKGFSEEIIAKRVALLNNYYNFYHDNDYDNVFSSQGKFRSTILEEFMFILFKDYIKHLKKEYHDAGDVINSGSARAYTNLYFKSRNFKSFVESPDIEINVKNQDFAIYREYDLNINNKKRLHIRIPIVAVENKTYIDKTMLEGTIATAEKIKNGNPYSRFIVVSENYDVDLSVDPAYSRIDQIYVLRKCKRKEEWAEIDYKVVLRLFEDVQEHINRPWFDIEHKMRSEGVLI